MPGTGKIGMTGQPLATWGRKLTTQPADMIALLLMHICQTLKLNLSCNLSVNVICFCGQKSEQKM